MKYFLSTQNMYKQREDKTFLQQIISASLLAELSAITDRVLYGGEPHSKFHFIGDGRRYSESEIITGTEFIAHTNWKHNLAVGGRGSDHMSAAPVVTAVYIRNAGYSS
jgi:hypothetical protein